MTHTQSYPDSANTPLVLEFTEQELAAVHELSEYHQVSRLQAMRQALRLYQLHEHRIRNGETLTWSGDAARAQDFTGRTIGGVAQAAQEVPEGDYIKKVCKALRAGHQYSGMVDPLDIKAADLIEALYLAALPSLTFRASLVSSTNHQSLDQLLDGMTDENRHEELPTSPISSTEGK